jgi:hypothetical protein
VSLLVPPAPSTLAAVLAFHKMRLAANSQPRSDCLPLKSSFDWRVSFSAIALRIITQNSNNLERLSRRNHQSCFNGQILRHGHPSSTRIPKPLTNSTTPSPNSVASSARTTTASKRRPDSIGGRKSQCRTNQPHLV